MIFLTTFAFNGIYRVNLRGEFNVPYGYKDHLPVCDEERILAFSERLQGVELIESDFEKAVETARSGDFLYLDPPYSVAHSNNGFLKYNSKIFSWKDQERLAQTTKLLVRKGCFVAVSNAKHSSIREVYSHMCPITIRRFSRIAAHSTHRRVVEEYLLINEA
jgi:DNA adenine methylase